MAPSERAAPSAGKRAGGAAWRSSAPEGWGAQRRIQAGIGSASPACVADNPRPTCAARSAPMQRPETRSARLRPAHARIATLVVAACSWSPGPAQSRPLQPRDDDALLQRIQAECEILRRDGKLVATKKLRDEQKRSERAL